MTIDTEVISLGGRAAFYTDGDALIDIHDQTLCHILSGWLLCVEIRIPSGKTVRPKSLDMNDEDNPCPSDGAFHLFDMLWNLLSCYDTTVITSILFLLATHFDINSSEMPFSS